MPLPTPAPGSAALITGASSGIGDQFARLLAARGHDLIVTARRRDRLEALAAELSSRHGVHVEVVPADLTEPAERDRLAQRIDDKPLKVEILVNNAGFGVFDPFAESNGERELAQLRILVEAVVDLTHRYLPAMVARERGSVINVASTSGFQPLPFNAGYGAAKAYVVSLTEAIGEELKGTGVGALAVCPGPVRTEFQEASDATFLEKMPKPVWVTAERVAADALAAAEAGKRLVIPGGPVTSVAFAGNRYAPVALSLRVAARMFRRG